MTERNTIFLNQSLKVEIGAAFSKFVKLYRDDKWITISEKGWRFVCNNAEQIRKSLEKKSEFGLTITDTKSVKMSMFRDQPYVAFCETFTRNEQAFTKHVNFSKTEWALLEAAFPVINDYLTQVILYSGGDNCWYLLREDALSHKYTSEIECKLAPPMSNENINLQLAAFLIQRKIEAAAREECKACNDSSLSQLSHTGPGCMAEWEDKVSMFYATAKPLIDFDEALERLNKRMKWNIRVVGELDESKLECMVRNRRADVDMGKFNEAVRESYWSLYEYLQLDQAPTDTLSPVKEVKEVQS